MPHSLRSLGLASYPFQTVPPVQPTEVWIDREAFGRTLLALATTWSLRSESDIDLIWSDFGAGKTHALRYLQWLASRTDPPTLALYIDLPKAAADFKAVYEQIIPMIPEGVLRSAIDAFHAREGESWLSSPLLAGDRDTPRALWLISQLDASQPIAEYARKWLRGAKCSVAELKAMGGIPPLRDSNDATRTLGTICRLISKFSPFTRVALLLDEFQRIGASSPKRIAEVNAGIHTWYNSCPEGLSIVLVYSIGRQESIKYLVTGEVLSRVARTFTLETFSEEEGQKFLADVVQRHSAEGAVELFSASALKEIVKRLFADSEGHLTPRRLMQGADSVLEEVILAEESIPIDDGMVERYYRAPAADSF